MAKESLFIMFTMKQLLESRYYHPTDEQLKELLAAYLQYSGEVNEKIIDEFLLTSPLVGQMFPTRKLEITMEKTVRVAVTVEVTNAEYESIDQKWRLDTDTWNSVQKTLETEEKKGAAGAADIDYDFAVADPVSGKTLIPWN